jgi:hypothetical protein
MEHYFRDIWFYNQNFIVSYSMLGEIIDTLSQKSRNNYFVDDLYICGCATLIGRIINVCVRTPDAGCK